MSTQPAPIHPLKHFLAGGFGGSCLVMAGHPFDTVKVRLQTMALASPGQPALYGGAFDCFQKTFRNEGIRGFYKGMGTPILMVTPLFAMGFFSYGMGKRLIASGQKTELTPVQLFFAGAFSGTVCTTLVTPVERIKCLLQIQLDQGKGTSPKYAGPADCAVKLLKTGGISSLYRGFGASFARGIPQAGLYYMTYEVLKKAMANPNKPNLSPAKTLLAGGLTGVINWIFILPLDVLKSRVQTAPEGTYPRGMRDAFKVLIREEGPKGLYRGIVPVFIRAFPANAACFMGFEVALKLLNWAAPNM